MVARLSQIIAMFVGAQGAGDPSRERGAGDWQHYKPPSAVLKEVAARNAQPRLTGPRPPGPPPLQVLFSFYFPIYNTIRYLQSTVSCTSTRLRLRC